MAQIRVLSPVGIVQAQTVAVPALPQSWNGRTVGFLDNTKSNFDRLVGDLGALLRERYGVAAVVHRKKANASTPASPELIAELAKACDVVESPRHDRAGEAGHAGRAHRDDGLPGTRRQRDGRPRGLRAAAAGRRAPARR